MPRPVSMPNNPYLPAPHLEISNATYELEKQARAFEEGVDAGRAWGREEWRERIEKFYTFHFLSEPSTDPSGLVHWFVKELLGNWDID